MDSPQFVIYSPKRLLLTITGAHIFTTSNHNTKIILLMKKLYALLIALLILGQANAQDFKKTLSETATAFFKAEDAATRVSQSNRLVLIAKKFNTEWSAPYYAAISKILINWEETSAAKKDALLDESEELLNTAKTVAKADDKNTQSELHVLEAMIANARMAVDPEKRWQKYGKIFDDQLEQAKVANADNPRIYYNKGISVFFTPEMFGGGKKKALTYLEKAKILFDKEVKDDITIPSWGSEVNDEFIKQANQKEDK